MNKVISWIFLCVVITRPAHAERLIATDDRINDVRRAIASGSKHHRQAFDSIIERMRNSNLREAYHFGLG